MRQGNILNEATAVSLATFLGEAIRLVIQIVARQGRDRRMVIWASLIFGQIATRSVDGGESLAEKPIDQIIDVLLLGSAASRKQLLVHLRTSIV